MKIVTQSINLEELRKLAEERFGDMVKCVIDVEKNIMVAGGSLHADAEKVLLEQGSKQQNLWGINIYVPFEGKESIEFDSMINIRPSQGNKTRGINNPEVREKIINYIIQVIR